MALISVAYPIIGDSNTTEDPKILAALNTILNALNGGLNAANVPTMLTDSYENVRILRGEVNSAGALTAGAGFTSARTALGVFVVTYTTSFPSTAAFIACSSSFGGRLGTHTPSNDSATVYTSTYPGVAADCAFSFIAIGPA